MSVALVTGATGFVGAHLLEALLADGWELRILALPGEDVARWERTGRVAVARGDVRRRETLPEAMRGVDTVFHLAAIHGLWRPPQEYEDVNVGGAENVCLAALEAGVRRLLHVSTWTVYGMGLRGPVDEEAPLRPILDAYAVTKAKADERVMGLARERGLPAVVVRPGTMFGPGDRVNFGRMAERLHAGKAVLIGAGTNPLPFVYVTDCVRGMIAAAARGRAGEAYNLATDAPLSQADYWHAMAEELDERPPRLRVPYSLLYAAAYAAERAVRNPGPTRQPVVTRLGVKLFGSENRHAIGKARRELGYAPAVSVREGIRLTAAWYRSTRGGAGAVA